MQITIDKVTDTKQGQYGWSSKVWHGNEYFYVNSDATQYVGKLVEAEISPKPGKNYKVGKIIAVLNENAPAQSQNGNGNGKITWDAYRAMAEAAHELAVKLEPDELDPGDQGDVARVRTDRGTARAAILNTVMIAYSNGKITVPDIDDDIPPF